MQILKVSRESRYFSNLLFYSFVTSCALKLRDVHFCKDETTVIRIHSF